MKKLVWLFAVAVVLGSCKKEDPDPTPDPTPPQPTPEQTVLKIDLEAWFENDPLVIFTEEYINVSGYRVNVSELKMYLANMYAVRDDGETVQLFDIAFFNFNSGDPTYSVTHVPPGNYTQLGFGIGVPEEMNSPANPDFTMSIFDSGHPLSESNNMYWTWATGYRFVIFDGYYDTDPESTGLLTTGYSFHTGKDESYREVVFNDISFTVVEEETTTIHLDFAIDRFFYSDSDTVDIAIHNQSHGTNQELSDRISDNIQQAISFR